MPNRLSENTWYIESADDFYWKQNFQLEHANEFNKMWALYNKRLNQILNKDFEDISWQRAWDRLLRKVIRDKNKIQFLHYLKYLVDSWKIDSNNDFDDIDQIWDLQDKLRDLKEQTENLWKRDFNISWWRIWKYNFDWRNNIEYIWNNKYIIKLDFEKIRRWWGKIIKYRIRNSKEYEIWIKYDGWNLIKYYKWNNFDERNYLWTSIIRHKEEYIEENNSIHSKKNYKYQNPDIRKSHQIDKSYSRTKSYIQWATHQVYIRDLNMYLDLTFNTKK